MDEEHVLCLTRRRKGRNECGTTAVKSASAEPSVFRAKHYDDIRADPVNDAARDSGAVGKVADAVQRDLCRSRRQCKAGQQRENKSVSGVAYGLYVERRSKERALASPGAASCMGECDVRQETGTRQPDG
jgi:hypothetical protein